MFSTTQPPAKRLADVIGSYRPAKSLKNSSQGSVITSLDFDDTGEWLLAACDDESIQLYDCKLGKHSKELFSKKYGVHLARFTHVYTNCIYASTKQDGMPFISPAVRTAQTNHRVNLQILFDISPFTTTPTLDTLEAIKAE